MSNRYKQTYWTNISTKPWNFSFVKGEPLTYSYKVPLVHIDDNYHINVIDKIYIKCKMKRGKYNGLDIDFDYLKQFLLEEYGIDYYDCQDSFFKRDGSMFSIITEISLRGNIIKDKYLERKFMKERINKINKLKSKLK
jgi:hypothetical protein